MLDTEISQIGRADLCLLARLKMAASASPGNGAWSVPDKPAGSSPDGLEAFGQFLILGSIPFFSYRSSLPAALLFREYL